MMMMVHGDDDDDEINQRLALPTNKQTSRQKFQNVHSTRKQRNIYYQFCTFIELVHPTFIFDMGGVLDSCFLPSLMWTSQSFLVSCRPCLYSTIFSSPVCLRRIESPRSIYGSTTDVQNQFLLLFLTIRALVGRKKIPIKIINLRFGNSSKKFGFCVLLDLIHYQSDNHGKQSHITNTCNKVRSIEVQKKTMSSSYTSDGRGMHIQCQ